MDCNKCNHKKVCWQCREVDSGNPMIQNYKVCSEFQDTDDIECKIYAKWINIDKGKFLSNGTPASPTYKCTHCGLVWGGELCMAFKTRFKRCPQCGAYMKFEEEI